MALQKNYVNHGDITQGNKMNIDDFFYRMYRVVSEPVLALFSSMTLIFGGYYLKKPPLEDDLLKGLYPLVEKFANASILIGFIIITLFIIIKFFQNR
ncbi:hypothetical protein [Legionella drancourtii]|uniref:Uncharacterized protein n=2 Tax=Legionella TaxID=445 RepID=G9ESR4_9GAMM|nr:hypothetical protein [Legionella drancourtii]EHL29745.1 hypothetical protein LDG_8335 [Legionella drancourtii LLAP12]